MRGGDETVAALAAQAYDAALSPGGWQALAVSLERAFGGPVALCRHGDRPLGIYASTLDPAIASDYLEHYWRLDHGPKRLAQAQPAEVVLGANLREASPPGWSEYLNDYLRPIGCDEILYASPYRSADEFVVLSVSRSRRSGGFEAPVLDLLGLLTPHLSRAFAIQHRFEALELERRASVQALEQASVGVMITDSQARLRFANAVADTLLQDRELAVVHGRLRAPGGADDRALLQAISRVASLGVPETVSLGGAGGRSLVVYPGGPDLSIATGPCVLLLFSTVPDRVDEDRLARTFGLTPAEARLLAALVGGERVSAYAARNSVSITTAKTHLGNLFQKLGEQRQADLIRRVMSDVSLRSIAV